MRVERPHLNEKHHRCGHQHRKVKPWVAALHVRSNGEVERPRRSAGLATRAHTFFQRPRRRTTCASRPVPTLVRGRPHPAYCARAVSSAQTLPAGSTETSALTAAASATNAAEAEEITQDLAHGPRALPQSQTKGLCLGSSPLSGGQDPDEGILHLEPAHDLGSQSRVSKSMPRLCGCDLGLM